MSSLLDLLTQNQPQFQTNQALLIIGLQNDFLRVDGKLPVDTRSGFVDRIKAFIPRFRETAGDVIWVRTIFEEEWPVNDPSIDGDTVLVEPVDGLDSGSDDSGEEMSVKDLVQPVPSSRSHRHKQRALELLKRVSARKRVIARAASPSPAEEEELFLAKSSKKGPSCSPNTPGAEFADSVKASIDKSTDTVIVTSHYSAFNATQLLVTLRAKLITELYICGCLTNISVFATALDAARHGLTINLIEDCLGYRKQVRHDEALKRMTELMGAHLVTSEDLAKDLSKTPEMKKSGALEGAKDTDLLKDLVDRMRLDDELDSKPDESATSGGAEPPSIMLNGRTRTLSDISVTEGRPGRGLANQSLSDEQFAERLSLGASGSHDQGRKSQQAAENKPNLVKSKIRMRSRGNKDKKSEDSKQKAESSRKVETNPQASIETPSAKTSKKPSDPLEPPPRLPTITKAGSSDKLKDTPSKREQRLKSSTSQPSLTSSSSTSKDKESKLRLSLGRPVNTDSSTIPTSQLTKATTERSSPTSTNQTMGKKLQSLATFPVLGPGDTIAEGDSQIIYDFFPPTVRHPRTSKNPLKDVIFHQLYNEVKWQKMYHAQGEVPRLVCVQGEFGPDGSMPVYRHPSDQSMPLLHFSPTVEMIRDQVQKIVKHPVNHVLIQLYRSGQDYISEHSDKTLDIVRGSSIVNVSFGAQRTMRLRTKKSGKSDATSDEAGSARNTQRVAMPHNSIFVLGQDSNMRWLHGINADKRLPQDRSEAEKAYSGMRISLTFRHIGTFLDSDTRLIWGQGASSKDRATAKDVINDEEDETEKMIHAFGKENQSTEFDWNAIYGAGFDVLHFRAPPKDDPILFTSHNSVQNRQVAVCLSELGRAHIVSEPPPADKDYERDRQVCYRDADINHTEVLAAIPILLYLDRYHHLDRDERGKEVTAQAYVVIQMVLILQKHWFDRNGLPVDGEFVDTLEVLEERQGRQGATFIAGPGFSIADCAIWPLLDDIIENWGEWTQERFPSLTVYYQMLWKKRKCVGRLRSKLPQIK
ncbi:hypothetical protein K432DRAFT_385024 [Lepidopterella palustris CBS 459.81]|uniref:Fe2OG dioxygenase domain-containing protein n=1 Tax=Lepidopterella palustris CBS 459.81 TaxID=1314670 RepID=A0A8E2JC68_9PEZI|nr:hypothetical protein K432DRAFT_385024 [Lepidopterella palustris CBS 459.81]